MNKKSKPKFGCKYCEGEPEPGWIEMDNNGPIVPCPICNNESSECSDHLPKGEIAWMKKKYEK